MTHKDNFCPAPEIPPMGHLIDYDGQSSEPGTIMTYGCRFGYDLIGPSQLTCTSSGQWSSKPPTCLSKYNSTFFSLKPKEGYL